MIHELNRYIPTAAALGGLCTGALLVLGDLTGAGASGAEIFFVTTTIYEYCQMCLESEGEDEDECYGRWP